MCDTPFCSYVKSTFIYEIYFDIWHPWWPLWLIFKMAARVTGADSWFSDSRCIWSRSTSFFLEFGSLTISDQFELILVPHSLLRGILNKMTARVMGTGSRFPHSKCIWSFIIGFCPLTIYDPLWKLLIILGGP